MNASILKSKLKSQKQHLEEVHAIRLHRVISWLEAADSLEKSPDFRFISLWVSCNSLYAINDSSNEALMERQRFADFINKLVALDTEKRIYHVLWNQFSGPIRLIIENQFVYAPFWDHQRGMGTDWESGFRKSIVDANTALASQNVPYLLRIILDRLYVLRNQIVHGGATYNSRVNRSQLKDASNILGSVLPIMIDMMLENPNEDWGTIYYPPLSN